MLVLTGLAWLCSRQKRQIRWRPVFWGITLQMLVGVLVFLVPLSRRFFLYLNQLVLTILETSREGIRFVFGPLAASPGEPGSIGFLLAFQVLPVVIFFSAFSAVLYYLKILPPVVRFFAKIFHRFMLLSGAESLCGAANIFVGVESALLVRPYLESMTRSELAMVLTCGMATVASSTLGMYVSLLSPIFPGIAGHLISASILSIPAAAVISKILVPETERPLTSQTVPRETKQSSSSFMAAVVEGSQDGLRLAAYIGALLIALLGLLNLVDRIVTFSGKVLRIPWPLSFTLILQVLFYPLTALLGITPADLPAAARLLGERIVLTEVVPYQQLAELASSGGFSDPRSIVILSYALCGFTHVASIAIFVGGTAALAPARRDDLARLGPVALLAATLATLMTGCVAGIFCSHEGILLSSGSLR